MIEILPRRNYHPFEIIPVSEKKVIVHKGLIFDSNPDNRIHEVNFAKKDLNVEPGEILDSTDYSPLNGDTMYLYVVIESSGKGNEQGFCEIFEDVVVDGTPFTFGPTIVIGAVPIPDSIIDSDDEEAAGDLFIGLDDQGDPVFSTTTIIKLGSVTWTNGISTVNQHLNSDIYCCIVGRDTTPLDE